MSHPYRTRPTPEPIEQPNPKTWHEYRAFCLLYTLLRKSIYLVLASALFLELTTVFFFAGLWFALLTPILALVMYARCPFCKKAIPRGPAQHSYWAVVCGRYPNSCTHCHAPVGAAHYEKPPPGPTFDAPRKRRRRRPARRLADDVLYDLSA